MSEKLDFLCPEYKFHKNLGLVEVYPTFIIGKSKDLMIRGKDFYAIWNNDTKLWTRDESEAIELIDEKLDEFAEEHKEDFESLAIRKTEKKPKKDTNKGDGKKTEEKIEKRSLIICIKYLRKNDTGSIDQWHKYVQKQMRDTWHQLDNKIAFSDQETTKKDYATKKLNYALDPNQEIDAYDKLFHTLYSDEELQKLEWAVGSIVAGDSPKIQKMIAIYGDPGTGKTTYLKIIEMLFENYCISFHSNDLVGDRNQFSLEPFKDNPLVAIDEEAKLGYVKDITILNSIVSHDRMRINEKFKSTYEQSIQSFVFIATNEPVDINSSKSGMNRRLIDVRPTGITVKPREYDKLMNQIQYELGGIAYHCLQVYKNLGKDYYRRYEPREMKSETDDFYNFINDELYPVELELGKVKGLELSAIWRAYKEYCEDKNVRFPVPYKKIKGELNGYFKGFTERHKFPDGHTARNYYYNFDKNSIGLGNSVVKEKDDTEEGTDEFWLKLHESDGTSIFDKEFTECPAQMAVKDDKTGNIRPERAWAKCMTKLKDINPTELHYVKPPSNVIFIDFDEVDEETGEKSLKKNLELVKNEWNGPPTYTETSKSGNGIHLIYFYNGDISMLASRIGKKIEVKTMKGNSSMRRKLIFCNDLPIATISGGLPLKEDKPKVIEDNVVKNERHLRNLVIKGLQKKVFSNTKPSVDFIKKVTDEAYDGGIKYDISDLRPAVMAFAANSTNNSDYCLNVFDDIHFKSEDDFEDSNDQNEDDVADEGGPEDSRAFFDIEVFPNLLLICWKYLGEGHQIHDMINPTPGEVEAFIKTHKLIGFNNRKYDNHIIYARTMGYNNRQIFELSKAIVSKDDEHRPSFGEAWNLSYADVYDFCSKKQSLKKWEIELGIFHKENEYPWDKPLDESHWEEVISYCHNDVTATEAVWNARYQDFVAREILAKLSGLSVNHTTRQHATKIIFGNDKHPKLVYTDLSKKFPGYEFCKTGIDKSRYTGKISKRHQSIYLGEDPSEGGYVYAEPGMYYHVALDDVESLHPHSIIALNAFGEYTKRFEDILEARLAIKHHDYEKAGKLFGGQLKPFLDTDENADKLQKALKIVINSVYGFTSATFDNPFRDPRNVDNIVAKRGALFMIKLKHEVQEKGFTVAHVKTDSIKIPNATDDILDFCQSEAKKYGYHFDHEATFEKFCLVNESTYICKVEYGKEGDAGPGEWSATGAQFQVPYVFKKFFGNSKMKKGDFTFDDFCETKTVEGAMYLDCNEGLPDVSEWEKLKEIREMSPEKRSKREQKIFDDYSQMSDEELDAKIAEGHNYVFIGKVGRFTPVKDGVGGGYLVREQDGKKVAVTGTKRKNGVPYRWMESSTVQSLDMMDSIDISYYEDLANEARKTIEKFGNFDEFIK